MVADGQGTAVLRENIGGDKIVVGDIEGSYAAIGAGASVIVNQIQQAMSAVDELEKSIQLAERKLAESIQNKMKNIAKAATISSDERRNPYKALLDYELQDAPFFYGRSDAIKAMQEKMQQSQLTILYSESGSGKSSLLQAGLASRLLAEGHFPLYLRPYRLTPTQSIKRAFLPDYDSQPELSRFADEQMSLNGFLARVSHYLGERRFYIFIDQFEEFFTEQSSLEQEAFAETLQACVDSGLPIWWVLALRKEYFSELRLFRRLKPFDNAYFLPTFKLAEAQEVIFEPAKRKGISYEEGLIDKVLADLETGTEGTGIPPVQMQLVCYTLYEELEEENANEISFLLYQKPRGQGLSGSRGILTSHLSRVLNRQMSGRQRQIASRALEALTNSQKMRVKKAKDDLVSELGQDLSSLLDETLDILHNNHLIRLETDKNDEPIYELTHDYLLAEIEIDPESQGRKLALEIIHQELLFLRENNQSRIADDKLAIIEPYLNELNLSPEANHLIDLSQAAVQEQKRAKEAMRKRQLYLAWSIAGVLVVITAILLRPTIENWYYQRQAKAATWLVPFELGNHSFALEGHEVSNEQYSFCVKVNVCSLPNDPSHGYLETQKKNLPVVGVTAYQAHVYCKWLGRQLPTAMEWSTVYTQTMPSIELANLWHDAENEPPILVPVVDERDETEMENKIFHLIGNAMEWTRTFVSENSEQTVSWGGALDEICTNSNQTDCEGFALQTIGGGIASLTQYSKPDELFPAYPFGSSDDRGFRCVTTN